MKIWLIKFKERNYKEKDLNSLLVCVTFKTEQSFYGLNILKFEFSWYGIQEILFSAMML